MAETVSVHVPLVEVRKSGGKWEGFITTPWFRYLQAVNPQGYGTGTGVLHGNASGSPTWGPVDLTADVTGVLPTANGGLGGLTGVAGGLLYATGTSAYAVTAAGTAHQVLHGGTTPAWGSVDLGSDTTGFIDLASQVTGALAVAHGGTGVSSATGSGAKFVLWQGPELQAPTLDSPIVNGPILYEGSVPNGQVVNSDARTVSITNAGATTLVGDGALFFIVHDKTSGNFDVGTMDATVGPHLIFSGTTGISYTRAAGTGLQAQVTAGTSPRSLSIYAINIGAA